MGRVPEGRHILTLRETFAKLNELQAENPDAVLGYLYSQVDGYTDTVLAIGFYDMLDGWKMTHFSSPQYRHSPSTKRAWVERRFSHCEERPDWIYYEPDTQAESETQKP